MIQIDGPRVCNVCRQSGRSSARLAPNCKVLSVEIIEFKDCHHKDIFKLAVVFFTNARKAQGYVG